MDLSYLRTLVDFHYWSRDRVLTAVAMLDAEQYTRPLGGSFGSVRDTLNHTYGAEVLWLRRWFGESPTAFPADMPATAPELGTAWRDQETALRAFVQGLDEQGMHRIVAYRNLAGVPGESPVWQMLVHVVNHATYHRGQVATLLRQLGATPAVSTDLIGYFRERAGVAAPLEPVQIQPFTTTEASAIASLHAASWRRAYRGILTDTFLGDALEQERRAHWSDKLHASKAGYGWLARVGEWPAGFVFVRPHEDAQWGTLVDNLHVLAAHQGRGIGRLLLHTVADWARHNVPDSGIHLWVFADNRAAREFYARVGGKEVELVDREASDGRLLPEYRVAWDSPASLLAATTV